jgi:hypothetical protein
MNGDMKTTRTPSFVLYAHPSQAALDAIVTLRLYSAGKADAASVSNALQCLEHIYGQPVKSAAALFRRSLYIGNGTVQREIRFEALTHIADWVFRHRVRASLWSDLLTLCRALRRRVHIFCDLPAAGRLEGRMRAA